MNAALDVPLALALVDPCRFQVRGWVWANDHQSRISAIEAWVGGSCIGSTSKFMERADVVSALALPASARPGFDFFVSCLAVTQGSSFELSLKIRWAEGSLSESFSHVKLSALDLGIRPEFEALRSGVPNHEGRAPLWLRKNPYAEKDFGVEIGAFKHPIPSIRPIYLDRFPEYDYEKVSADYVADAATLPVESNSLDYVANANVFEHLANPVLALWEWARVCRHNGIIYLVVPDRRLTFDRNRPLTDPAHMIDDFNRATTDSDGTHVLDYIDGVDWSLWAPLASEAERVATRESLRAAYLAAVAAGEPINIHFHTFELSSFVELIRLTNLHKKRPCDLEIVDASEYFPDSYPSGFLVVLRVKKVFGDRLRGYVRRVLAKGNPRKCMSKHAKPFV